MPLREIVNAGKMFQEIGLCRIEQAANDAAFASGMTLDPDEKQVYADSA